MSDYDLPPSVAEQKHSVSGKSPVDWQSEVKNFWFIDVLVVLVFLTTAVLSIYMFRQDLMLTLESRDENPVGTIIIRNNIIQRRYADRVIWERLFVDSPVYSGDLIRAADLSDATIHLNENEVSLNENTLIRIQQSHDGSGSFQVDLREGNLSVTTSAESVSGAGIVLNIMGREVQTAPGTVLSAELGDEGMVVQVTEGEAVFIEEGETRQLSEGTMIAKDSRGVERKIAAAVVTRPQPNARYLLNSQEGLPVDFAWKRINLDAEETLRLEIASDRNFSRDLQILDGLVEKAQMKIDAGNWHWRLLHQDAVLRAGELTVTDASGPELLSPAFSATFRYQNDLPQLRFQWSERPGASHYILEVSWAQDFSTLQMSRQVSAVSFISSELGPGTWHWRVRPVFPSNYNGKADYSEVSNFQIEQTVDTKAPVFELPVNVPKREPPRPPRSPARQRELAPVAAPVQGRNYTVKRGDTLSKIADFVYGDSKMWRRIFQANDISDPDLIHVNQVLFIP